MHNFPTREELVEVMARAIYVKRNGVWDYNKWRSDSRISEAYTKDAQAALDALLARLPDSDYWYVKHHEAKFVGKELVTTKLERVKHDNSREFYQQLLSYRRKDA